MVQVTPRLLALIPFAVGVNLALGQLAAATALPVFLDTVGTILVATLAGLWPALLTGLVSQVAAVVIGGNAMWLAFLPVQLAIGAYAALAAHRALFRTITVAIIAGFVLGAIAAHISWPISFYGFGGVTGGGVTMVTAVLTGFGLPLNWAVYVASLSCDLLDKTVCFALVHIVLVSLPERALARYPAAQRALGRA